MMLTQDRLRQKLHYDPATGVFRRMWNSRSHKVGPNGAIAGSPDEDGYIRIRVDYKRYPAHRLAFLYMTGSFPEQQVDHVNLDKSDNRWENLREATAAQNAANKKVQATKRELKGVYPEGKKFRAISGIGGKTRCLGSFSTQEEANSAYFKDARKYRGEFARS